MVTSVVQCLALPFLFDSLEVAEGIQVRSSATTVFTMPRRLRNMNREPYSEDRGAEKGSETDDSVNESERHGQNTNRDGEAKDGGNTSVFVSPFWWWFWYWA